MGWMYFENKNRKINIFVKYVLMLFKNWNNCLIIIPHNNNTFQSVLYLTNSFNNFGFIIIVHEHIVHYQ